jgi:hypothetical protein
VRRWIASLIWMAGIATGQVVQSKHGPVEFIGLENWTPAQVQEKLERLPDGEIHYCAADLKTAGMADASVVVYIDDDKKWYTVVGLVEGQRAGEIARRARPAGDLRTPAQWDYESAVAVLGGSKDKADRAAAAKAMRQFANEDGAWRALAAAMRDPDDEVSMAASGSLNWMRRNAARKVDWSAASEDLAALLHGANLFGFNEIVRALVATEIDPAMAGRLLGHGGGRLLLVYLGAQHDAERDAAHDLLTRLRGQDLGADRARWQEWLSGL